ncbi:MAG: hypothetical protein ACQXXH_03785 [Candidatus Bathyarchaeia archaeon]|jgi:hypothetical protein|nr:hypothetical protein [Candidatus Bathyarchaeota archaeon A05DMB-4]MDH7594859.1 hypothetical protein [Candidatus Bathyarchaeota archaeon]
MKKLLEKKGQFSIIAAALVAIVLATALITTYSMIRNNPLQERPQILGSIDEMNLAIDHILEFAVGYYGSILQITGNTTYAQKLATEYLVNGLQNIAYTHPSWNPTFEINHLRISASWFNRTSSSEGAINVTYSLAGLGISGIKYSTSLGLKVTVNPSTTNYVLINVSRDGGKPYPTLSKTNFLFYNYSYVESDWEKKAGVAITSIVSTETYSTYEIMIPNGVDPKSYMVLSTDPRGITVVASTFSHYTYSFSWNQTLYSSLNQDVVVVEALQNGSLRWLGQNLQLTTPGKPIPPVPIRALRVNQTINGVNREVPFQVEDWGSAYRVPLGISSNASIFTSRNMLVFLWNHRITNVTLWWDGRDKANQTSYAFTNRYFTGDNPTARRLTNGILTITISSSGFTITSSIQGGTITSTASFMRINKENPAYGASPSYVIHHGIVRDIVQQEAEWSTGAPNCTNVYSQMYFTLPANATYYTYALRTIFVDSLQSRTLTDLSAIRLTVSSGLQRTENGTSGGYPVSSSNAGLFYNFTSFQNGWAHHWSEFISGTAGAGIMFTDDANRKLYLFDNIAGQKTGALNVTSSGRIIEFNPVGRSQYPASFQNSLDVTWFGAVVNFYGTDPIYPSSGNIGLWILVEKPPTISVN